jgi:hypothetical protein
MEVELSTDEAVRTLRVQTLLWTAIFMTWHHEQLQIGGKFVGYARVRNDGMVLSIWINQEHQQLFLPDQKEEEE